MDDILSQGGDREPSPWPRRLAAIAVIIGLVVAGAVYLSLPRHRQPPVAALPAPATASPVPSPPPGLALPAPPPGPDGIAGHTLAWDPGLRLPVAGTQPAWFSPASGRSEAIGGLPDDRSGYQFTRAVGGWAVQASSAAPLGCGTCAGPPAPVWFLADGARSVTRVGTASLVAPAATAGAVWLTSYTAGARLSTTAGIAWEASATGAPLRSPVRLPPGYMIDQGTDRGLLLTPVSLRPGPVAYKLWNPAAPRDSRAFNVVIAASPAEIAWTSLCAPTCRVQVLDLATGRQTVVALPAGSLADSGEFSPDGGFLALLVGSGDSGDDGEQSTHLDVESVKSGRLTSVPGTYVSSEALIGFGWPAGGDSLVAEFSFTTRFQLASWRPGASWPAVTAIRAGADQASLILG